MNRPFSAKNCREIISFDQAIRKKSRKIYKALNREQYIKGLRETHFRGYIFHKLKFNWLQKKGKYLGLDF